MASLKWGERRVDKTDKNGGEMKLFEPTLSLFFEMTIPHQTQHTR